MFINYNFALKNFSSRKPFRLFVLIPFRYGLFLNCLQKYYILGRNKNFLVENPKNLVTFVDKMSNLTL